MIIHLVLVMQDLDFYNSFTRLIFVREILHSFDWSDVPGKHKQHTSWIIQS